MNKFTKLIKESHIISNEDFEDYLIETMDSGIEISFTDGYIGHSNTHPNNFNFSTDISKDREELFYGKLAILKMPFHTNNVSIDEYTNYRLSSSRLDTLTSDTLILYLEVLNNIKKGLSHAGYKYQISLNDDRIFVFVMGDKFTDYTDYDDAEEAAKDLKNDLNDALRDNEFPRAIFAHMSDGHNQVRLQQDNNTYTTNKLICSVLGNWGDEETPKKKKIRKIFTPIIDKYNKLGYEISCSRDASYNSRKISLNKIK